MRAEANTARNQTIRKPNLAGVKPGTINQIMNKAQANSVSLTVSLYKSF